MRIYTLTMEFEIVVNEFDSPEGQEFERKLKYDWIAYTATEIEEGMDGHGLTGTVETVLSELHATTN